MRQRSSRSKTPSPAPTTKSLALSPIHERLENLEKENQLLLGKIKKKRKELDNLIDDIRSLATEIFSRTGSYLQKISTLDEKIHAIFKEILAGTKLGKQSRKKIEKVYLNLQLGGLIHSEVPDEDEDEDEDDDEEGNNFSDFFSETEEEPSSPATPPSSRKTDESRHIRQTFLKLAENFHPDKVTDSETQSHYTEIMKELNRAYQEKDLARLLEIERQHLAQEKIDINSEDDVTRHCQAIEKENQVLKHQHEQILQDINRFKRTPEGDMVKDYRRAKKEKIDIFQSMIEELEEEIGIMQEIQNFVQDFHDKKMTIAKFVKGPEVLVRKQQENMQAFMEEMLGISFDDEDEY